MSRLDAVSYLRQSEEKPKSSADTDSQNDDIAQKTEAEPIFRKILADMRPHNDSIPQKPVLRTPMIAQGIVDFLNELIVINPKHGTGKTNFGPSFTFGIYGAWGSGKSTLLHNVSELIENENGTTVSINAWKWDGQSDIFTFMLDEVLASLRKTKTGFLQSIGVRFLLWFRTHYLKVFFAIFSPLLIYLVWSAAGKSSVDFSSLAVKNSVVAVLFGAFIAIFAKPIGMLIEKTILSKAKEKPSERTLSISYRYLLLVSNLGRHKNRPIFFFIDDLDRCNPDRVLTFMESVHLITGSGNIVLMACDDRIISSAIYDQFSKIADLSGEGKSFGVRFLEKIVQAHFRMPDLCDVDLIELGLHSLEKNTPSPTSPDISTPSKLPEIENPKDISTDIEGQPTGSEVDDLRLSVISGEVLSSIVSLYRVPIRRAKLIANLMKLYTMVFPPINDADAYRLTAFVGMAHVDSRWISENYLENQEQDPEMADRYEKVRSYLGTDKRAIIDLYPLCGIGVQSDAASDRFQRVFNGV